jgi:hypothetical protein
MTAPELGGLGGEESASAEKINLDRLADRDEIRLGQARAELGLGRAGVGETGAVW